MKRISITVPTSYDIIIDSGALSRVGGFLKELYSPRKVCIIADSNAGSLYSETVITSLRDSGFTPSRVLFPAGEHSKNLTTCANVLEALASENLSRSDVVLSLGGGVTTDIAGFVAGTYMRGIDLVHVPTTLLSAMDATIGGKAGVNLLQGKNLAGLFWPPRMVICDPDTFKNLREPQIQDALAEGIKNAVISDASMIPKIQAGDFEYMLERSLSIKKSLVEVDSNDKGLRQLLNFGHTIGHCIEKASSYSVSHGQAVSIGMVAESKAAFAMGYTNNDISGELTKILEGLGLPTTLRYSAEELYTFALIDKKISDGMIALTIPESIGKCTLKKVTLAELSEFFNRACD
ncbi:MAG: 3-dehydroquinate synthase [Firmicutes bacterium]|nr:3-dehydroquinate synthase [Bacillota bacterium]